MKGSMIFLFVLFAVASASALPSENNSAPLSEAICIKNALENSKNDIKMVTRSMGKFNLLLGNYIESYMDCDRGTSEAQLLDEAECIQALIKPFKIDLVATMKMLGHNVNSLVGVGDKLDACFRLH